MTLYTTDEQIAVAANAGDRDAIATYFARNLGLLSAMSRRIAMNIIDPEDLLAEAITRLVAIWADGRGPTNEVTAYVIRSMRNRVVDELRSPRSKVAYLDTDFELAAPDSGELREVELADAFAVVRAALDALSPDYRAVLQYIVVDGLTPREVAAQLGRSSHAIVVQVSRAKVAMRRELLRVLIKRESDAVACRRASDRLPKDIPAELTLAEKHDSFRHIATCPTCSIAWARFTGLAGALGVVPLIVLVASKTLAIPAVVGGGSGVSAAGNPSGTSGLPTTRRASFTRRSASRNSRMSQSASASAAATVAGRAGTITIALIVAGGITAGVGTTFAVVATTGHETVVTSPGPHATLIAAMRQSNAQDILNVDLSVEAVEWRISRLQFDVPGQHVEDAPRGWRCTGTSTVTCVTHVSRPRGGDFTLAGTPTSGSWSLSLRGTATHHPLTGTAHGPYPPLATPLPGT